MLIVSVALCCPAFGEKKQPVSIKVPAQFTSVPASGIAKDTSSLAEWWNNFHDPELQSLIQRALVNNLDVRVAQAKLRESRATLKSTRASNQLPTVNVNGSYTRSKTSSDNPQTPTLGGGTPDVDGAPCIQRTPCPWQRRERRTAWWCRGEHSRG